MLIINFRKLFLSLLILFICFSCNRQRTVKEYYDDGTLKYELQILNNEPHGYVKTYYPNGKLKELKSLKQVKVDKKTEDLIKGFVKEFIFTKPKS